MIISGIDILNESVTCYSFYTSDSRCNPLFRDYFEATYFGSVANMGTATKFHGDTWNLYDSYLQYSELGELLTKRSFAHEYFAVRYLNGRVSLKFFGRKMRLPKYHKDRLRGTYDLKFGLEEIYSLESLLKFQATYPSKI